MRGLQGLTQKTPLSGDGDLSFQDDRAILRRFYRETEEGRKAMGDWEAEGWGEEEWQVKVRMIALLCQPPRNFNSTASTTPRAYHCYAHS